jgi:NtrC-family two-component system sensor histidine kinase KinB
MSVRGKLLLAQVPLAVALAVVGIIAVSSVSSLGRRSEITLRENYRSVVAAQRMREALEQLEDTALVPLAGAAPSASDRQASIDLFERELAAAEGNVTEANEPEMLQELRRRWQLFRDTLQRIDTLVAENRDRVILDQLRPQAAAVREQTQLLLEINQDAMVQKSARARQEAAQISTLMVAAALVALLLGLLVTSVVTRRLVQPLELLARTVAHLREGDFDTRVNISGRDEVAQLAASINDMATRLSHYRSSSLGELLLAQEASQAAIDSLPDPVAVFDLNGNVLTVNRAAERLHISLETGGGTPLAAVDAAVRDCLERARLHVLAGKGPYVPRGFDEAVHVTTAEGESYFLPRATPVYSEAGAISGATVILQDVTRLRRVDDLRSNLVATVAHELRTPLTSLRMAIHLCLEQVGGPLSEKQADLLYAAREECERLQAIVDELLDLARIQSGRIELRRVPIAPAALLDTALDTHRSLAEEQHLYVEREDLPLLPDVLADRERIQLVLSNLLTNAIRHTPPGGRISLRAGASNGAIRFEVADTGPGIPPEYQASIFDRFVRVAETPGGTGLGLSIAKEIVEAHGGRIGVDSAPGEGATFWFTLPAEG